MTTKDSIQNTIFQLERYLENISPKVSLYQEIINKRDEAQKQLDELNKPNEISRDKTIS